MSNHTETSQSRVHTSRHWLQLFFVVLVSLYCDRYEQDQLTLVKLKKNLMHSTYLQFLFFFVDHSNDQDHPIIIIHILHLTSLTLSSLSMLAVDKAENLNSNGYIGKSGSFAPSKTFCILTGFVCTICVNATQMVLIDLVKWKTIN